MSFSQTVPAVTAAIAAAVLFVAVPASAQTSVTKLTSNMAGPHSSMMAKTEATADARPVDHGAGAGRRQGHRPDGQGRQSAEVSGYRCCYAKAEPGWLGFRRFPRRARARPAHPCRPVATESVWQSRRSVFAAWIAGSSPAMTIGETRLYSIETRPESRPARSVQIPGVSPDIAADIGAGEASQLLVVRAAIVGRVDARKRSRILHANLHVGALPDQLLGVCLFGVRNRTSPAGNSRSTRSCRARRSTSPGPRNCCPSAKRDRRSRPKPERCCGCRPGNGRSAPARRPSRQTGPPRRRKTQSVPTLRRSFAMLLWMHRL